MHWKDFQMAFEGRILLCAEVWDGTESRTRLLAAKRFKSQACLIGEASCRHMSR